MHLSYLVYSPSLLGALALGIATIVAAPAPARGQLPTTAGAGSPDGGGAWHDCALAAAPDAAAAVARAGESLRAVWLETRLGLFAAYTMAGEVRNPFDLSPRTPGAEARGGLVQARRAACAFRPLAPPETGFAVRFTSPYYRFHEAAAGWSVTLRDGLLMELAVVRSGAGWTARELPSEKAVLLAEQKPRRPIETELPKPARWAAPVPACGKAERWSGEACVPRRR
ncbi:MAG: hypothetical protein AB7O57_02540 [Hyphomicrobiaceae bacterium]